VVDASALAALLFGEPEDGEIAARLEGARLVAPFLLGFELASVCLKKARSHPDRRGELVQAFRLRDRLGIESAAVDYDDVVDLASATGLTVYDASYLWLARHLDAELVTLDRRLAQAERAARA
jgi:predicted nucleic acid-binding protein